MRPFLTVREVIDRAVVLIADHPLMRDPIVLGGNGKPLYINRIRKFDGFDLNQTGITMSIVPYAYYGTSNETVESRNAALTFKPYNVGGRTEGLDLCQLSLVVKLQTTGIEHETEPPPPSSGKPVVVESLRERYLQDWLMVIRTILLTNPIENLQGLVKNSTVNWASFRTIDQYAHKGANYVIHEAALLWQLYLDMPRNWAAMPNRLVPNTTGTPTWLFVGYRTLDEEPIYWDTAVPVLTTLTGYPVIATPQGVLVSWDPAAKQFTDKTGVPLTAAQLVDSRVTPPLPWIQTDLVFVGVMNPSGTKLYWNTTLLRLQTIAGTLVTALEDGTPIFYDPTTGQVFNGTTNQPVPVTIPTGTDPTPPSDPLVVYPAASKGLVSIYDVNSLKLRERFEL